LAGKLLESSISWIKSHGVSDYQLGARVVRLEFIIIASFGIANTMIMSILERTREIGIMKSDWRGRSEIKLIFFSREQRS